MVASRKIRPRVQKLRCVWFLQPFALHDCNPRNRYGTHGDDAPGFASLVGGEATGSRAFLVPSSEFKWLLGSQRSLIRAKGVLWLALAMIAGHPTVVAAGLGVTSTCSSLSALGRHAI